MYDLQSMKEREEANFRRVRDALCQEQRAIYAPPPREPRGTARLYIGQDNQTGARIDCHTVDAALRRVDLPAGWTLALALGAWAGSVERSTVITLGNVTMAEARRAARSIAVVWKQDAVAVEWSPAPMVLVGPDA